MSIWSFQARVNGVIAKLRSAGTRSRSLANSIDASANSTDQFFRVLISFCSAAKIANLIPTNEADVNEKIEPISVNFTTDSKTQYDCEIEFYVDPYDTSLVLDKEKNGRLAIADNVFTRPEISSYLTDTPYLAIDFTGTGTNPLQFIYDCCRVLNERAVAENRSYPDNNPGFFINVSKKSDGMFCNINFNYIVLTEPNLPFYRKIGNDYIL